MDSKPTKNYIMKRQIIEVFNQYSQAYYSGDFKTVIHLTDLGSLENYVEKFKNMASAMDILGESDSLYRMMDVKNIEELDQMSTHNFYERLLKFANANTDKRMLQEMNNTIEIKKVDINGLSATLKYEFKVTDMFGDLTTENSTGILKNIQGDWKVVIKEGFKGGFKRVENQLRDFYDRKSRDKPEGVSSNDELERVILVGYRHSEEENIVIEPRFKDGGEFSEGLAYVKVISHYGFIDISGEIVIRPRYIDARDFSEGLAGDQIDRGGKWGFIDKLGEVSIEPRYENVTKFSEGRCAVQLSDKWGFIDNKGAIVIDCNYLSVSEFYDGIASVSKYSGVYDEDEVFLIDRNGITVSEEE